VRDRLRDAFLRDASSCIDREGDVEELVVERVAVLPVPVVQELLAVVGRETTSVEASRRA
jgi:hypothetical protein